MSSFVYPTNAQLSQIDQQYLGDYVLDDPVFGLFPIRSKDTDTILWEQKDNYTGLAQIRGMNGAPNRVQAIGGKRFRVEPSVFGEFREIDEEAITARRQWGQFAQPVDISDLVMEAQNQLRMRQVNRMRHMVWSLLVNGYYTVQNAISGLMYKDAVAQRTYAATVSWAASATAAPLYDFRQVLLMHRGYSTSFGSGATAYMNRTTLNNMLSNSNSADLYGRRVTGLATANTLPAVNELFAGDGLPTIVVYDEVYPDDNGDFQLLIPDNKVVVFGRRLNNAPLGQYTITRNASATPMGAPATYTIVHENERPPKVVTVDYGFNAGMEFHYPGSVVVMSV